MEQRNMQLSKLHQQLRATRESINKIHNTQQQGGDLSYLSSLQSRESDLLARIEEAITSSIEINQSKRPNAVIPYVGCNVCSTEIAGDKYRRRCTECEDYDICNQCFEELGHPHPTYEEQYTNVVHQRLINSKSSLAERFETAFRCFWRRPCLGWRPQATSPFVWITFSEVYRQCMIIGYDLGVSKGEAIAIHSRNRIEWVFSDLGGTMNGLVVVPIHHAIADPSHLAYILHSCHIKVVICESEFTPKFLNLKDQCSELKAVVELPLIPTIEFPGKEVSNEETSSTSGAEISAKFIAQFAEFQEKYGRRWEKRFLNFAKEKPPLQDWEIVVREPSDVATIIHTSGSTGKPKGAPFTDRQCINAINNSWAKDRDPYVEAAMDPLSYISGREHLHSVLVQGGRVGFTTTVFEDLREIEPFSLACTPRFWNVFQAKFRQALLLEITQSGATTETDISAVREKVKQEFRYCLGTRLTYVGVGGAGVSPTLLQFMRELFGERSVADGYGSTETGSIAGRNGVLARGVQIKLEDVPDLSYFSSDQPHPRGLLWVKTNDMIAGYFNDPEESANNFVDGWFCTGDIVEQLGERQIQIIDRRKNFFKLSQGEYIAAEKLENIYLQSPFVDQILITCGDISMFEQTSVFCIVVPNHEMLKRWWLTNHSNDADCSFPTINTICESDDAKSKVLEELHRLGSSLHLAPFELPGNIILEPELFTIENGKMTSSNKLARAILEKCYNSKVSQVLADKQPLKEEQELSSLLCELLNLEGSEALKSASLPSLGADSLSAVRLSSLLKYKLKLNIPPHLLLDPHLSLAKLQELIKSGSSVNDQNKDSLKATIQRDMILDSSIKVTATYTNTCNCILLTGCTGFVGAFLLRELLLNTSATIYTLVRCSSGESPLARLQKVLSDLQISDSLSQEHKSRILPLGGDLEMDSFGLSSEEYNKLSQNIDVVFHCAAGVNHILPYHSLFKQNVLSSYNVISFCTKKPTRLNFISTSSAVPNISPGALDSDVIRYVCDKMGGYEQTKFVAEKLVTQAITERGVSGSILRLGLVAWDTQSGACNERDWLTRLMTGIIFTRKGPAESVKFEFTHVDQVCEIICKLGMQEDTLGQTFSIFDSSPSTLLPLLLLTPLHDLLRAAQIKEVSTNEWWETIHQQINSHQNNSNSTSHNGLKFLESLLLFQDGLPNDEKWINKAQVHPNFIKYLSNYTPKRGNCNVEKFIEFICKRLKKNL